MPMMIVRGSGFMLLMAMDAAVALDAEETKGQEESNLEEKKSPEDKPDGAGETSAKDSEFLNALDKKIDRLLEFLDPATKKEEKDPMDEAIESLEGGKDEDPKGDDQENGEAKVVPVGEMDEETDRKSTRLNSSHANISYAVFCLKKGRWRAW